MNELKCVSGVLKSGEFIDLSKLNKEERAIALMPASYLAAEYFVNETGGQLIAPDKQVDLEKFHLLMSKF